MASGATRGVDPDGNDLHGDRTGLKKRWRPADEPNGEDRRRGHVRPMGDRRRAHLLRRRGQPGRRRHNQKPRGTQVAVRRKEVFAFVRPHCALRRVNRLIMTDPVGGRGLLGRVLRPVQDRTHHAPRAKRHEENTGRDETKSAHGISRQSKQDQDTN